MYDDAFHISNRKTLKLQREHTHCINNIYKPSSRSHTHNKPVPIVSLPPGSIDLRYMTKDGVPMYPVYLNIHVQDYRQHH